ncbi:MAG: gliding motility-associated C-terminal domain-containing protein, partial [Bacteroidales bacterium]|nr:gliding motility-associated C-terminal domain-containing protein [Bacteroidales bacterium]
DTLIVIGNSTVLNATGADTYLWNPATALSCNDCANPTASPENTIQYCVIGSNTFGCADTACITITVDTDCGELFIPLAFSPNGNGKNDTWKVQGRCIKSIELYIYDRWGEKVFESFNQNDAWDGTFNGKPLDTDVYVYMLTIKLRNGEEKVFKGNITLLR